MVDDLCRALRRVAFRFTSEAELHEGIATALEAASIPFEREHRFGPADRVDFFIAGLALEVKIDGSVSAVTRQLHRYAQHPNVRAIVLATTKRRLCAGMPDALAGKPVFVITLNEASL